MCHSDAIPGYYSEEDIYSCHTCGALYRAKRTAENGKVTFRLILRHPKYEKTASLSVKLKRLINKIGEEYQGHF